MKHTSLLLSLLIAIVSNAQTQEYDVFSFSVPSGWKKTEQENLVSLSASSKTKGGWAQIGIIKSTDSKGSVASDFNSEWQSLVIQPYRQYGVSEKPLRIDTQTVNGWKVQTGTGKFLFNKDSSTIILSTFSDGLHCASIRMMSNTSGFQTGMESFLGSLVIKLNSKKVVEKPSLSVETATGFQFNTTNFDDGWTSTVKEDWVEAVKGNIKVLLHFPREEDKNYYTEYKDRVNVFWNLLVAPRYTNLRNYQSPGYMMAWEPAYFAAGLVNDKQSGKDIWVALFSKGKSGWIEVIAPDKKTFVEQFGVDQPDSYFDDWKRLLYLSTLNRFAIGEKDLEGKWSNDFFGATSYYNIYSGMYAGSTSFSSKVIFEFSKSKTYNWSVAMAQGATGSLTKMDGAKASGSWKLLGNWQVWLSQIEGKPKTYNAYFSCIKGGRVLWLQDIEYGNYQAHGKISK